MEELEKDFVPHDRALRMKALGFDEPCFGVFELIIVGDTIPKFRYNFDSEGKWFNHNKVKDEYNNHDWYWSAPTFSQAFGWFREKYDLHLLPIRSVDKWYSTFGSWIDSFEIYEQAELACLDKLIKIVEGIESQK